VGGRHLDAANMVYVAVDSSCDRVCNRVAATTQGLEQT
jgi:hypothetical protein